MSHETRPISPHSFLLALPALPFSSLTSKQNELENSVAHLLESNQILSEAVKEGEDDDGELQKAILENEVVIARIKERVELVKLEISRRKGTGGCASEADEALGKGPGLVKTNGHATDPTEEDENDEGVHL